MQLRDRWVSESFHTDVKSSSKSIPEFDLIGSGSAAVSYWNVVISQLGEFVKLIAGVSEMNSSSDCRLLVHCPALETLLAESEALPTLGSRCL